MADIEEAGDGAPRIRREAPTGALASVLAVRHPGTSFVVAAAVLVAGLVWVVLDLARRLTAWGTLLIVVLVVLAAAAAAAPGVWSLRHRELAVRISEGNRRKRAEFLRDHRLKAWVGLPLVGGASGLLRTDASSPTPVSASSR